MKFRVLPVHSAKDATENFEQLQALGGLVSASADTKITFGRATAEYTVKAFVSGKEAKVVTGLTKATAAFAISISSETFCSLGLVEGGKELNIATVGRVEQAAGTKVEVFWLAIGN